jgi:hypothetical protein
MQCSKCGAANPDEAFFCGTCGVQLRSSFAANGPVALGPTAAAAPLDSELALDAEAGAVPFNANPFGDTEPTARRAFEDSFGAPPPAPAAAPPPTLLGPPPPAGYQAGPAYQQPPPGYQPQPPVGYGPAGYRPPMPLDGNTSGMGDGYPIPPEASGWSFAGFVPWGLFCFFNGNPTWGAISIGLAFVGLNIVSAIYVGVTGKENAWRNRRFESIQQYLDVMRAWNLAGIWVLAIAGVLVVFYILFVIGIIGLAASGQLDSAVAGGHGHG